MKFKHFKQIYTSILSCTWECLMFLIMIHKKIIYSLIALYFLAGCTSPTAMIGPVYTLSSTGSIFQTGLSYGSNEIITRSTGKTPIENVIEISSKKNIQKQTLESEDFYFLVKNRIEKTGVILKKSNQ